MSGVKGIDLPDYSPESLAERLGISRRSLDRAFQRGEGPARVKIGRRAVILRATAEAWLREQEKLSAAQSVKRMLDSTLPGQPGRDE